MSGFSTKLRERLHGLLSDVVVEATSMEGFADPAGKMARIRKDPFLGPRVETMASTLEVFAMIQFPLPNGEMYTKPVRLVGVDAEERGRLGGFKEFLQSKENQKKPSFE